MKKHIKIIMVITLFLVAALITSSTAWYNVNNEISIGLDRIKDCVSKIDVEYNYTCLPALGSCGNNCFDVPSPNYAVCYDRIWNAVNSSYGYNKIFSHSFLIGDLPSKTIWWNKTIQEASCINTGEANVYLNKSDKIFHWICDYSSWGECKVDKSNKRFVCDSKKDGNADGICNSGESCLIINITKEGLHKAKNIGFSNVMGEYDIECEIQ